MRRALIAGLVIVLLLAAGCGSNDANEPEGNSGSETRTTVQETTDTEEANLPDRISTGEIPQPTLPTRPVVLGGSGEPVRVRAEIADDNAERTRGLMAREELGEGEGMLFVFDSELPLRFVMENTLLPLSIAYIDEEGRIVDIQDMQPRSGDTYPSAEPARYALEVNQGFFEENGVEVGDSVDLPRAVTGG